MKLSESQREEMINQMIDDDIEASYKYRDQWNNYYHGILPYKDTPDQELIDYYEEREMEIPVNKETNG